MILMRVCRRKNEVVDDGLNSCFIILCCIILLNPSEMNIGRDLYTSVESYKVPTNSVNAMILV
jgi:hypothetical protein